MKGCWVRTLRIVDCVFTSCAVSIPRGELVYLLRGIPKQTVCATCAKQRFDYDPPTNIPEVRPVPNLPPVQRNLGISDSREPSEGWIQATGARLGAEAKRRLMARRLKEANATDGRLRQLGGDQ